VRQERPPAIRVITVNYNAGALLTECIRRVAASTVPVEIVVVDNASSDDSLACLRAAAIPNLTIVGNAANLGFSRANNLALRGWTGDYALLLNPDCLVEPDTIEKVIAALARAPEAGMAGCLIRNPDGSEQAGCRRLTPTPGRALRRLLGGAALSLAGRPLPAGAEPVEAISGAFMLVRRAALEEVGLLDEGYFMHCEDLDWCIRFRQAGWSILFVPAVAVTHVKGVCSGDRAIRVEWYKHRGMVRYYCKFFRADHPAALIWLASLAIWLRFGAKALVMLVRSGRS
jgi:GT2 family glycosyltransferase